MMARSDPTWDRPTPRRRWRRWLLRLAIPLIISPVVGVSWDRHQNRTQAEETLTVEVARLDAADPGWRLEDLYAAHAATFPPPDENVIHKAVAIWTELPPAVQLLPAMFKRLPDDPPGPTQPPADTLARWTAEWDQRTRTVDQARALVRFPRGGYRPGIERDPAGTRIPHVDAVRLLSDLLHLDAKVSAVADDPGRAVASLRAIVTLAGGLGAEPSDVVVAARLRASERAADGLERVLAWTRPVAELAELQGQLTAEADADLLTPALRGARAYLDRVFERLDDGTISPRRFIGFPRNDFEAWMEPLSEWYYRGDLPADRARLLELITEWVEVSRRPSADRRAEIDAVPLPTVKRPHLLACIMMPNAPAMAHMDCWVKARLRCAATAIACERFRQAHGRWPDALADLPNDLLPAVPLDPFDGRPLRYARTPDGAVVYSVGPDRTDDGGTLSYDPVPVPGQDIGFRLWDSARRRERLEK